MPRSSAFVVRLRAGKVSLLGAAPTVLKVLPTHCFLATIRFHEAAKQHQYLFAAFNPQEHHLVAGLGGAEVD